MKTTKNDMNRVFLRGKVSGRFISPKLSRVYISVKDYQQRADADGYVKRNMITVTFYGEEGARKAESIDKYDRVEVEGVIQSVRDPKRETWNQECWGLDIRKTKSLLEEATDGEIPGDVYPEDEDLVVIRGKVMSAHGFDDHWVSLTVKTAVTPEDNKRRYLSNNSMTWHTKDSAHALLDLELPGTEVIVIGKLETVKRKSKKGRDYDFEGITVRDLRIINPSIRAAASDPTIKAVVDELKKERKAKSELSGANADDKTATPETEGRE